ncbi:hypothetical protein [Actibacterium mucosum]|nr:hypothetical protein [Actibacterium mucosum]
MAFERDLAGHLGHMRYPCRGFRLQFYLIYFSSLFCLTATGWAAALFL